MTVRKHLGVTLIELMIVIAIAATMFAVAVPAMNNMTTNSLADRLARDLELDMRYARSQASALSRTLEFEPLNNWRDGWKITDTVSNDILRERRYDLTANTITSAEIATGTPLVFAPDGRADNEARVTIAVPGCTGNRIRTFFINRIGQLQLAGVNVCP